MNGWKLTCGMVILSLLVCFPGLSHAQLPPPVEPPVVVPAVPYVPVTVVLDLDAVMGKLLKEQPPGQVPPPPPAVDGKRPIFGGGLLKRLRDRKPLRKLLANLAENKEIREALENMSEPVDLGENRWLSLNMKEIVLRGTDIQLGVKPQAVVFLAVHMEPTIVFSKEKPAPMPLPQLTFGKELPPPSPNGTPVDFVIVIDPKSTMQVLPEDAKKELAKYGIDPTQVKFFEKRDETGQKVIFDVPMKKPLAADLKVWFSPQIKDNYLTFANADCDVITPPAKDANSVNQTLQQLAKNGVRTFVLSKMKTEKVDLRPHIKRLANLPVNKEKAGKVRAPIGDLRIVGLNAVENRLVVRITGTVGKEGIVIFAP